VDQPNGDIAVICGATGGLGPAVVDAFLERGDRVIAAARSPEKLKALRERHESVVVEAVDLTNPGDVEALWVRIDGRGQVPHWLVNLTGGFAAGRVVDTNPEDFDRTWDLNLGSAWWSCRAGAQRMAQPPGGAIVNVSSRAALVDSPGSAVYSVAKAAVVKLTTVLAAEVKGTGLRVNAVLPSVIDTPANHAAMSAESMRATVPPEAIAAVIAFLCSDAAAAVTGAVVPVYGA
jgi:NAD(P)-dependent dehydrogenase (short-subunit alcohol dehydrogenase family)